jgi:hypothetical protein
MGGIKHMNRTLFATCILALAFAGTPSAQGAASYPETDAHYTKAELKQLTLNAHAPAQYTALASYFSKQRDSYLQKAAEEKKEWERLSQNVTSAAAKYPRPADSVRNYYEFYMHKASEAGTLEAKYSRLAAPNAPVNAE